MIDGKAILATIENPEIGQILNGKHLGKAPCSFIYARCKTCGKLRWVRYHMYLKGQSLNCQHCGMLKSREKLPHNHGNKHHNWHGGKHITKGKYKGYVAAYVPRDSIYSKMAGIRPYVPEHRLVMAEYLGRCLEKEEFVHHKNGIKTDNRIENLELTSNGSHIKEHSVGYTDGYKAGFSDGRSALIRKLNEEIKELKLKLSENYELI